MCSILNGVMYDVIVLTQCISSCDVSVYIVVPMLCYFQSVLRQLLVSIQASSSWYYTYALCYNNMYTSVYVYVIVPHLLHIYFIYNTTAHTYVPYLRYCGLCIVYII